MIVDGEQSGEAPRGHLGEGISRAEFLKRGAALGTAAASVGMFGAACGSSSGSSKATVSEATRRSLEIGPWTVDTFAFEPGSSYAGGQGWENDGVLEGLVTYPPSNPPKWEQVNVLAESLDVSSDRKQIAFKLKQGVEFHRGFGEVTADDVKFSVRACRWDPEALP